MFGVTWNVNQGNMSLLYIAEDTMSNLSEYICDRTTLTKLGVKLGLPINEIRKHETNNPFSIT